MAEQRVYQGHTYQRAAPGQPWSLVGPAQTGVMQLGGTDPEKAGNVIGQGIRNTGGVIDNRIKDATAGAVIRKANADAAKAEADARQASGLDPQKLANIRAAQSQIDRINQLYMSGPGKTKGFSGVLDYLPTAANKQFDTAGAGLGEVGLAAFRTPGVGSQSDTELRAFIDANRPSASDYDAQIKEKLRNLQNRLDQTYSAYRINRQSLTQKKGKKGGVIDFNDLPE